MSAMEILQQLSEAMKLRVQEIVVDEYACVCAQREQTCHADAKPGFGVGL